MARDTTAVALVAVVFLAAAATGFTAAELTDSEGVGVAVSVDDLPEDRRVSAFGAANETLENGTENGTATGSETTIENGTVGDDGNGTVLGAPATDNETVAGNDTATDDETPDDESVGAPIQNGSADRVTDGNVTVESGDEETVQNETVADPTRNETATDGGNETVVEPPADGENATTGDTDGGPTGAHGTQQCHRRGH